MGLGLGVLYLAFAVVALWLLGELLLQRRAPVQWRALALVGFLALTGGVAERSLPLIAVGVVGFGAGQAQATRAVKRGGREHWTLRAAESLPFAQRLFGAAALPAPPPPPAPRVGEVSAVEAAPPSADADAYADAAGVAPLRPEEELGAGQSQAPAADDAQLPQFPAEAAFPYTDPYADPYAAGYAYPAGYPDPSGYQDPSVYQDPSPYQDPSAYQGPEAYPGYPQPVAAASDPAQYPWPAVPGQYPHAADPAQPYGYPADPAQQYPYGYSVPEQQPYPADQFAAYADPADPYAAAGYQPYPTPYPAPADAPQGPPPAAPYDPYATP